jgi:ABC-type dipeptide/oligopeptide/nickel transport system permease component
MDRFKGQSGAPSWWFGAPLLGVLFGFVANRFFPGFVESSATLIYRVSGSGQPPLTLTPDTTRFLAPLVGMLLAVMALGAMQLAKRLRRMRNQIGA